jgi:hypothetical protein
VYSKELFEKIIEHVRNGKTTRAISLMDGMPNAREISRWATEDRDGLGHQYRLAMDMDRPIDLILADVVLERARNGESLAKICRDPDMPDTSTVLKWADREPDGFGRRLRNAREEGYLKMFDEITDLMDKPDYKSNTITTVAAGLKTVITKEAIEHRRLQIETRKWALGKMMPKIFGQNKDEQATVKIEVQGGLPE